MDPYMDPGLDIQEVSFEGTTPRTKHLRFTARWALLEGQWECVGLGIDLAAHVPLRPLQRHDLDVVKMGEVLERGAELLRDAQLEDIYSHTYAVDPAEAHVFEEWLEGESDRRLGVVQKRPGRPRVPEETLQRVAEVYNEAYRRGAPTTQAVMDEFGIKTNRAKRWVWQCRQNGMLPPTRRGIARGKKEES